MARTLSIEFDHPLLCADFVRLNEQWIAEHFEIEASDRRLAADPMKVIADGGHLIGLTEGGRVLGVCALFNEGADWYQLARMAVEPAERGKGLGDLLIETALAKARERGAASVHLLSNTALTAAISLYRKHGFVTVREGPHPVYVRCNIVMERVLSPEANTGLS